MECEVESDNHRNSGLQWKEKKNNTSELREFQRQPKKKQQRREQNSTTGAEKRDDSL